MFRPERAKQRVREVFDKYIDRFVKAGGDLGGIIDCAKTGVLTFGDYLREIEKKQYEMINNGDRKRVCNIGDIELLVEADYNKNIENALCAKMMGGDNGLTKMYEDQVGRIERALKLIRRHRLDDIKLNINYPKIN